jgi:DNA-binding NarL/FixJ family response regulator
MNQKASILLVDDHPVFRQGLAAILRNEEDLEVVAEAGDGQIALEMIREHAPDIVVRFPAIRPGSLNL